MDAREIERGMYRGLLELGEKKFGAEAWALRMARYRLKPREFALKVLGSRWWSAQDAVARALMQNRRVVVRSGNGVGKTYLAADLALWFLYTHQPAVVLTTAPTWRQVKHVLWHEIRKRHASARKKLPGRLLQTRIDLGGESFAVGLATEGGVQFQGFHCENLLIILDEASGIADDIWDAAEGVAVGGNNKILAIGNPLVASGRFYQAFKGATGWTKRTINGLNHPNVTGKGKRIPGCVTRDFVDEKVEDWCEEITRNTVEPPIDPMTQLPNEDVGTLLAASRYTGATDHTGATGTQQAASLPASGHIGHIGHIGPMSPISPDIFRWRNRRYKPGDMFRIRILGEFPNGSGDCLIPLRWIEAAQARKLPAEGYKRIAVDVARFGDDDSVIGLRVGPVCLQILPIHGDDTMELCGEIKRIAFAEQPSTVAIDAIGMGAGVVDCLVQENVAGIDPVNVSDNARDKEHFANRRAELYWGLRERFHKGDIQIPDDAVLAEELSSLRYFINSRGQFQMESKAEMKRRLKRSPDRADMLAILFDSSWDTCSLATDWPRVATPAAQLRAEMQGW